MTKRRDECYPGFELDEETIPKQFAKERTDHTKKLWTKA